MSGMRIPVQTGKSTRGKIKGITFNISFFTVIKKSFQKRRVAAIFSMVKMGTKRE